MTDEVFLLVSSGRRILSFVISLEDLFFAGRESLVLAYLILFVATDHILYHWLVVEKHRNKE